MAALEQIGVVAIAQGADKFIANMNAMERAYDKTTKAFEVGEGETKRAATGTEALGKVISGMLPQLSGLAGTASGFVEALGPMALVAGAAVGGLMLLKKAFDTIVNVIQSAISAIKNFVTEGMHLAGRFQEMEFSALAVGRAMGMQESEIRKGIDAIADAGIRYDVAAKTAAQFAKNQIDFAQSGALTKIAQGAAIMAGQGEDSTATMERLTHAVITGSQVMFRNMNITVNLTQEYKKWADANDRAVESLTEREKIQIRVNAVIANGASLLDVYAAAMESPTKRLRSLTGRELPELKAAIGAPFQQAWATIIGDSESGIRGFVNALQAAASEGGALYPILINLGAIASILADAFSAALGVVTNFVSSLSADLGTGFGDLIVEMARWGAEMVAALAEGIIGAASTVLVTAMNFIGSVLGSWLGPGSPPKVAPLLDKWGMQAMTEYLKGFTEADYSILEKIQGPLSRVLDPKQFAAVSADIIEAMSTGGVGEPLFQRIAESAGVFGEEIAELARLQFELADATKAVEDAENRVAEGRQQVRDLTAEYNQMLREGASKEQLEAKLAEINAAEEGVAVAKDEAAEAQARAEQLEEQAMLQEKLVGQMLKMTEAVKVLAKATETMGKIPKPKAEPISPEDIVPEGLDWEITSKIGDAIDAAKAAIYEKLLYIFAPLAESWERIKTGPLAEIVVKFQEIAPQVVEAIERIITGWNRLKLAWEIGKVFIESVLIPKLNELSRQALELLKNKLDIVKQAWDKVKQAIAEVYTYVTETFIPFLQDTFAGVLDWFKDKILKPFADMWDRVKQAIESVKKALEKLKDLAEEVADALRAVGLLGDSPSKFEMDLKGAAKAMRQLSQVEFPRLAASVQAPRLQNFTPAMAYGGGGMAGGVTRSVSVQVPIGPIYISNDMDAEAFQIKVERAVVRATRRFG